MRVLVVAFCLIPCLELSVTGQENPTEQLRPEAFTVRVTEFELKSSAGDRVSNSEILKKLTDLDNRSEVVEIQTLRLSAIDGQEAMVQFGRRVTITTGSTTPGRGFPTTRQTQFLDIGTLLRVSGIMHGNKCQIAVAHEVSRLVGEGTEDSPPDMVNSTINGTYVATLGEPILLGGINEGKTNFLVLTVER